MRGDFLACDRLDLIEAAGRIAVPTLVICGAEDKMTPPALSQAIAEKIPGARLALVEGAGHMVMLEDPVAFNSCLLYTSPSPRDRTRSRMPSSA